MIQRFLVFSMCFFSISAWAGTLQVLNSKTWEFLTTDEFREQVLAHHSKIFIGETHNSVPVQNAEAWIINEAVAAQKAKDFTWGWEFLNYKDQGRDQALFESYREGQIDVIEFLKLTQNSERNKEYIPVLETVAKLGGKVAGLNLSREDKAPIVKGGIGFADPNIVPVGYETGSAFLFERFKEAMGDHVSPDRIQNYFDAQSLTDDVMAVQFAQLSTSLKVSVAGSFHTDFFDGMVRRYNIRNPGDKTVLIKIVDTTQWSNMDFGEWIQEYQKIKYGTVADWVLFVN